MSLASHRDPEAGAPVEEQGDVPPHVPPGAAVHRPLGLAEVLELGRRAEVRRLHRAHGQDGGVGEQVLGGAASKRQERSFGYK